MCENVEKYMDLIQNAKQEAQSCEVIASGMGWKTLRDNETGEKKTIYETTQAGVAKRLADKYKDRLSYSSTAKKWRFFSGVIWEEIDEESKEIAEIYGDIISNELNKTPLPTSSDENEKKKLQAKELKERRKFQQLRYKNDVMQFCQSYLSEKDDVFDNHPYMFALNNGVYDFENDKFINDPDQLKSLKLTMKGNCDYNPDDTEAPAFNLVLNSISNNDKDIKQDIFKALAPLFIDKNLTQQLIFLHGNPRNGKTTLLTAVLSLLGDYGLPFKPDLFSIKKNGGASHDADLVTYDGKRGVIGSEIDTNNQQDIEKIKLVTGHDRVTLRPIRESPKAYLFEYNIVVAINNPPFIPQIDTAVKERFKFIPALGETVAESSRVSDLPDKIANEKSAIFNMIKPYIINLVKTNQEGGRVMYSEKTEKHTADIIASLDWYEAFYHEVMCPMMEKNDAYYIQPSYIVEFYDLFKEFVTDEFNGTASNKATFRKKIKAVMLRNGWDDRGENSKYMLKATDKQEMIYNDKKVIINKTGKRIKCLFNQSMANVYYNMKLKKLSDEDYHSQYKRMDMEELHKSIQATKGA